MNKKGSIALFEISIMILGIVAVAWMIGEVSCLGDLINHPEDRWATGDSPNPHTGLPRTPQATPPPTPARATLPTGNPIDLTGNAAKGIKTVKLGDNVLPKVTGKDGNTYRLSGDTEIVFSDKGTIAKGGSIEQLVDGKWKDATSVPKDGLEISLGYKQEQIIDGTFKSSEKIFYTENGQYRSIQNGEVTPYKNAEAYYTEKNGEAPKFGEAGGWFGEGTFTGALWQGVQWAGYTTMVIGLINLFASKSSIGKYTEPLQWAAPAGMFVGKSLWDMTSGGGYLRGTWIDKGGWMGNEGFFGLGEMGQWASVGIGLAVAAAIYIALYKDESYENIIFTCDPWDAPVGGKDCERCNEGELPCSEYQCRSLGQACELENADTDSPMCFWKNRYDVTPPVITLWEDVLTAGLKFSPLTASAPKDNGTKIVSSSGKECIPAYTPLAIGIKTDEPARCKVDLTSKNNFSDMSFNFGNSIFEYEHILAMSVPGQTVEEGEQKVEIQNGGVVQLYVRCQDPNGNTNEGNFVFQFCVDDSEDVTAPLILGTNILNDMPIAFNTSEVPIEVYTNEPADCRWDMLDKGEYEEMKNTMSCTSHATEINAQMVYTCRSTLTGIKSGTGNSNNFYFKCRDQPGATSGRNTNAENYKLTLHGTQPLVLDYVTPSEMTIKDNTNPVNLAITARTSAGYKDGQASCYYKLSEYEDYIMFFETGGASHSQKLSFVPGEYNLSIKCVDLGGNSAEKRAVFNVESDRIPPHVQRIFKEENNLRIITNEDAECVYDSLNCNFQFSDGIAMTSVGGVNQYTEWRPHQTYYIKCMDSYGNQPNADSCTIRIRMTEEL